MREASLVSLFAAIHCREGDNSRVNDSEKTSRIGPTSVRDCENLLRTAV